MIVYPIGRMVKPTSWDRILQDDPLEVIPEKLVSDVNTTGPVTIIVSGNVTNLSGPITISTTTSGSAVTYLYSTEPPPSWPGGNSPGFSSPREPTPYPRNRKERHAFDSLSLERLDAVVAQVDKTFGPRTGYNDEKWNAAFWEKLNPPRERTSNARSRQAKGRPR